ncbi:MAG: L-arabinose isomerase, partial [Calditrichaeota bacterium]
MQRYKNVNVWFVTGSQHLYGEETLKQVAAHSQEIVKTFSVSSRIPIEVVYKPVMITPDAITQLCQDANSDPQCIGIITWMHTFSPAKMWIAGLSLLRKPMVHLHTQYNREIPWADIDMDFMNLNQSAHGGREFGFINTRLRINRKVIVGFWQDAEIQEKLAVWMRAAAAWHDWQCAKVARFGDNMREVAVTEGDKVEAQKQFGFSVNGYGVGDLAVEVNRVAEAEIDAMIKQYQDQYVIADSIRKEKAVWDSLRDAAKIEVGMRKFLAQGGFKAFTTTFEDLHGLVQLPGLAVQRLMADGYGFGAEGDWKTAALVRAMKVMAIGMKG